MTITVHHLASLSTSAINERLARRAQLASVTETELNAALGESSLVSGDAITIPYFCLDGTATISAEGKPVRRFRIFDEQEAGTAEQIYLPKAMPGLIYLPLGLQQLIADEAPYIVITIGELKALAGVAHGIAAIGLSGARSWRAHSRKDDVDAALLTIARSIGRVIVLGDSDVQDNASAKTELKALSTALKHHGVVAAFGSVPVANEKLKRGPKPKTDDVDNLIPSRLGLDGWIARNRSDVDPVFHALEKLLDTEETKMQALQDGGYIPLGHCGDGSVVLSIPRAAVVTLSDAKIASKMSLNGVCGDGWVEAKYGETGRDGKFYIDCDSLGKDIMRECNALGLYSDALEIGNGLRTAHDDPNVLIVNNGNEIWRTDGKPQSRVTERAIFIAGETKLGLSPNQPQATAHEAAELLSALQTWKFSRASDAFLMLGWVCDAYLAGAKKWRTHGILTGDKGYGKSGMLLMFKFLLGGAAIAFDAKTSEAGLRQRMRKDSVASLIDEGERTNSQIVALLDYLRTSSSGGEVNKGTSGMQGGITYLLRTTGLISAVNAPLLDPIDASRYLIFKLTGSPKSRKIHPLANERMEERTREFGKRLFSRMVHSWPRITRAHEMLADILAIDAPLRYGDTLAPVLASGWCALNDGELTETEAHALIASIDLSDELEAINGVDSSVDLLRHITGQPITISTDGKPHRMTIAMACTLIANQGHKAAEKVIGTYGLKITREERFCEADGAPRLLINEKAPELKRLLRDTKWEGVDLDVAFKRIPGAWQKKTEKAVWIGGETMKALNVPIEIECQIETVDGMEITAKPLTKKKAA